MKRSGAAVQNTGIWRTARQFVLLPLVLVTAPATWAKRFLFRFQLTSTKELDAFDERRRTGVRRNLRGMPPDPIAESPKLTLMRAAANLERTK
jgi:hypothetical protein